MYTRASFFFNLRNLYNVKQLNIIEMKVEQEILVKRFKYLYNCYYLHKILPKYGFFLASIKEVMYNKTPALANVQVLKVTINIWVESIYVINKLKLIEIKKSLEIYKKCLFIDTTFWFNLFFMKCDIKRVVQAVIFFSRWFYSAIKF